MKKLIQILSGTAGFVSLTTSLVVNSEILVGGSVAELISINIEQVISISELDLSQNTSELVIATATANSNIASGYNVTISTANDFQFASPLAESAKVSYELLYGSNNVQALSLQGLPAYQSTAISNGETHRNVIHDIKITYQGVPNTELIASDYSDTIEIKIQAN